VLLLLALNKGEESEIVVAYVIGQGLTPLDAITVTRTIDDGAQNIFDLNFLAPKPPPATTPVLTSGENFIDIVWETDEQVAYLNQSPTWDLRFHQFLVYAFRTNSTADIVSNTVNSQIIARYQVDNFLADVFKENSVTTGLDDLYPESPESNKLDMELYSDPSTGRLRLRIFEDPFNPGTLISKGTPYFFAVVGSAINYDALVYREDPTLPVGTEGDYYLTTASFVQNVENVRQLNTIVAGEQLYNPPIVVQPANQIAGASMGEVGYDVIINDELEVSTYEVTFFKDSSSAEYKMFWSLENMTTNTVLIDTSDSYTFGRSTEITDPVTEGFITRVEEQVATIDTQLYYEPESAVWYSMPDSSSSTGPIYVGTDIPQGQTVISFGTTSATSDVITADRLSKVELRFGSGGKAYRYLNGFVGVAVPLRRTSYVYAAGVTTDNPNVNADLSEIGKLGEGYVDVPFTAWDVDERYENGEQQLAVGFIERGGASLGNFPNGNPDGEWDPSDSLLLSGEVIVIFDAPYDPNGGQIEYTGGVFGADVAWADIIKQSPIAAELPDGAPASDEQRAIFNSPWFNPKYVLGLQRKDSTSFYTDGDVLTISLEEYPYTESDVYQFTIQGGTATDADQQELFNRVNVFPNPLYGFNTLTGTDGSNPDEPWVTFTNLPTEITIRIYSLSGQLLRTLDTSDKSSADSPFLRWDLLNENGLRAASGLYLAIVSSPQYGEKILKFTIIMPQKQLQRF
jgi:hypothetical protein